MRSMFSTLGRIRPMGPLSGAGGVAWRCFDQTLNDLGYLRERFRLSQKRIGATTPRFIFDFSRAISCQHHDPRLRVLCSDQPDHVEAVLVVGQREAQVLDNDFIVCRAQKFFSFFQFGRSIDFIPLQREVLAHRETDRLFVVDYQQTWRWLFSQRPFVSAEPHLSQSAGDFFKRFKFTLLHGAH